MQSNEKVKSAGMHCVEADLQSRREHGKKIAQLQLRAFVTKCFDC